MCSVVPGIEIVELTEFTRDTYLVFGLGTEFVDCLRIPLVDFFIAACYIIAITVICRFIFGPE